jgi:hypothetical protein
MVNSCPSNMFSDFHRGVLSVQRLKFEQISIVLTFDVKQ